MAYKPTTIKMIQNAIKQAGSIELDKVCQTLEDMMIERVKTTMALRMKKGLQIKQHYD